MALPSTGTDGMMLGAGGDRGANGAKYARHPTKAPDSNGSRAPDNHPEVFPLELRALLRASDAADRIRAWDAFLARHSRLLLHVARKVMPASESAMDAYAHVLEKLWRDDCRALGAYSPDGRSRFSTWLVVVARRMCVDFYRQRYGRPRGEQPSPATVLEREARHRLVNFVGVDDALAQIADSRSEGPDGALRIDQLHRALDGAVSALPPEDQLLIRLRFHDELPAQRIARVMGLPSPFHVYRRLKAVCAGLRRTLLAVGIEDGLP